MQQAFGEVSLEKRVDRPARLPRVDPGSSEFLRLRSGQVELNRLISGLAVPCKAVHGFTAFGEFVAYTHVGSGKRSNNEDGFLKLDLPDERTVLVALDGMGGQALGDEATRVAGASVDRGLKEGDKLGVALGPNKAGRAVRAMAQAADVPVGDGGSAVAGVEVATRRFDDGDKAIAYHNLRFYHSGDVRGRLIRNGQLKHITNDHSLAQQLIDGAGWTSEQARKYRNVITSYIGSNDQRVEVSRPFRLQYGDLVVLTSDGVDDDLTIAGIDLLTLLDSSKTLEENLQSVLDVLVQHNEKGDNVTIVLWKYLRQANPSVQT